MYIHVHRLFHTPASIYSQGEGEGEGEEGREGGKEGEREEGRERGKEGFSPLISRKLAAISATCAYIYVQVNST